MNFESFYDYFQMDVDYDSLLKPLLPYLKKDQVILDAGCGSGYITTYLAKNGYQMIGIDKNQEMLVLAKEKLSDENLQADLFVHDLNYSLKQKFDQIICLLDVFHYFKGVKRLIKNLYNGLNDDGRLILDLYKGPVNEQESDTFTDLSYDWKVSTKNEVITHEVIVHYYDEIHKYKVKQYYHPVSYYTNLLTDVGFKVDFVDGFDDRKAYLVCTK